MAKGDVITRKEIIEDEALKWGSEYQDQLKLAIKSNEDFRKGLLAIAEAQKAIKGSSNNSEYLTNKQKERLETEKTINAIKIQLESEKALEKIKQEAIRTDSAQLSLEAKKQAAAKRTNELTVEEKVQLQLANREAANAMRSRLGLTEAYDKLTKARLESKKRLRELIITEGEGAKATKDAAREFDVLDRKVKKADAAVGDFQRNVGNYPGIKGFTSGLKNLVGAFGLVGGVTLIASVFRSAAATVVEYQKEIVNLGAIAGKSRKEIAPLEAQIRAVAASSINSATDVAKLATELIKLGSTPEEAAKLLKPINDLSIALRASAEDSATLVKSLLNTFGEGAEEAGRYTDVLAAAANYTALGFEELRNSMSYIAPVANAMGYSIEQTAAMVGVLADNGIKAESAGRLLRTMMGNAAKEGTTLEAQLAKVAASTDKVATASKLFGSEGASLGIILANNKDRVAELTKEFENSKGSLKELTDKQLQSLDSKLKILNSTWEEFILSVEDGDSAIGGFVSDFLTGLTMTINAVTRLSTSWDALNKKAEATGTSSGVNRFQEMFQSQKNGGVSDQNALSVTIGQATLELNRFEKELDNIDKKLEERLAKSAYLPSSIAIKSFDVSALSSEKERLIAAVAERKEILRQATDFDKIKAEENAAANVALTEEEEKAKADAIKSANDKALKARADYLKKIQKLEGDAFNLSQFRLKQQLELSNEISSDETQNTEDRIEAYLFSQQLEQAILREGAARKLEEISKYNDEVRDLTAEEIEIILSGGQIIKKLTDDEILVYEEFAAKQLEIDKKIVEDKQKIIDSIIAIEQKKTDAILKSQDTTLNNRLLQENKNFEEELALLDGNNLAIEDLTRDHENRILQIKKDAVKEGLQFQLDATKKLLENENLSFDVREELSNKLSKIELEINQLGVDDKINTNEKKQELDKEYAERVKELQGELVNALQDLTNALFSNRIDKLDADIEKNEEYYNRQIELAGDDERQKEELRKESELKREELEKKKRKEQLKQAIFNKAMAALEIGVNTGIAIVKSIAASPLTGGMPFAAYAAIIGAVQLATVLATPLPKYKDGRKGGKEEWAFVGDGGVSEVIERKKGGYELTPAKDTLVKLYEGDKVHKSLADFNKSNFMNGLVLDNEKIKSYENSNAYQKEYSKEILEQMKISNENYKKQKNVTVINKNVDINHELWKMNFGNFKR